MLDKTSVLRPTTAAHWRRLLTGLWLSGLRLGEAMRLSWHPTEAFCVDLTGKHPRFRIYAEGQKAGRDELLPMTPDFAKWLFDNTPPGERHGLVFPLPKQRGGQQIKNIQTVSETITSIAAKANVKVAEKRQRDRSTGKLGVKVKFASAHDFRRAFGTRWSNRVLPPQLQKLMRHSDIQTTMRYYVDQQADDIAADLWERFGDAGNDSTNHSTVAENTV